METYLYPVLATFAGAFFLIRNLIHLRNEDRLRAYLETSPKAKFWVNKFGMEKTVSLSKKIFLPLGCVIGAGLFSVGAWSLSVIMLNA
jgi:uncharacterized membrane protein YbaN (DUF454 family)